MNINPTFATGIRKVTENIQKTDSAKWLGKVITYAKLNPIIPIAIAAITTAALLYVYKKYWCDRNVVSLYLTDPMLTKEELNGMGFFGSDKPIIIYIFKKDLQTRPIHHLQELCKAIKTQISKTYDPRIQIIYLKGSLTSQFALNLLSEGVDTGGLSRDYLQVLTKAFMDQMSDHFIGKPGSFLPSSNNFSTESQKHFECLGNLLMYCFHSREKVQIPKEILNLSRLTGQHFDLGLFKSVLSLSAEEVDSKELKFDAKLKICIALIQIEMDKGESLKWALDGYQGLAKSSPSLDSESKINDFLESLFVSPDSLPLTYQKKLNNLISIDVEAIKRNKDQFLEDVICASMFNCTKLEVKKSFKPIHAIAKGMKEICNPGTESYQLLPAKNKYWDQTIRAFNSQFFANKAQGCSLTSESRKLLAKNMIYKGNVSRINKDVKRLKAWILDPQTPVEDVKMFIKFTTGATTVQNNQKIEILETNLYPSVAPVANTCGYTLTFSKKYPADLIEQQLKQTEKEKASTFIRIFTQEMKRLDSDSIGFDLL